MLQKYNKELPPRAIVLGGGGSKGAYQVGVWQSLRERNRHRFRVITGTSVGALNGAFMAQDAFEQAYELWWNLNNTQVLEGIPDVETDDRLVVYRAFIREALQNMGASQGPLEGHIRSMLDEDALRDSGVEFGMVTVDMTTLKPAELFLWDMPPGTVADYLVASASFFPAMHPKSIGKGRFVDGGYHDNIPISMALRAPTAVQEILVVDVDGIGFHKEVATDIPITTLRSYWDLGEIMVFETERIRRNIRLGYLDAERHAGSIEGRAYAFKPGTLRLMQEEYLEEMSKTTDLALEGLDQGARLGIDKLVADRLTGAVSRRRRVATPGEMLTAAAETAAELLDMDPLRVYTLDSFEDEAYRLLLDQKAKWAGKAFSLDDLKGLALPEWVSGVRVKGQEGLLQAVLDNLRLHLAGQEAAIPTEVIAFLAPREFLASLYLLALERHML